MRKNRKTPELVTEAIRLRQAGQSLANVANVLGVSISSVSAWTRGKTTKQEKLPPGNLDFLHSPSVYQTDSNKYPDHKARLAAHRVRILTYLREHPDEAAGTAMHATLDTQESPLK